MKKITVSVFLFVFLFISSSKAQINPGVKTGWYYADQYTDTCIKLFNATDTVFIYPSPVISVTDFKKLKIIANDRGGLDLEVTLNVNGSLKFGAATKKWIGKKFAFVSEGELLMAPVVMSEISGGKTIITGNFTKAELNKIKAGIEMQMKKHE